MNVDRLTVGEDFVVSLHAVLLGVISPSGAFAAVPEAVTANIIATDQSPLATLILRSRNFYSAPNGEAEYRDERVCLSLCVSVCLPVHGHIFGTTHPIFARIFVRVSLPVDVARFSSGGVVICYVLPVVWTTSYLLVSQGWSTSLPN